METNMSYWRFAAMIATSTAAMFGLMYLNTYASDHLFWSETRLWMALLMGAAMAAIMLAFMRAMYTRRVLNVAIFSISAVVFALSLWIVRSQAVMDDVDYMKAMIPHHSIAILTSSRAQITDPRVRELADRIIAAQRREIAEMKYLVGELEAGRGADSPAAPEAPPAVASPGQAVRSADIGMTDLGELSAADIDRALGPGSKCRFGPAREAGGAMLAVTRAQEGSPGRGVVSINGRLVVLPVVGPAAVGGSVDALPTLGGGGVGIAVRAAGDRPWQARSPLEAHAVLVVEDARTVGYTGFYACQ